MTFGDDHFDKPARAGLESVAGKIREAIRLIDPAG